MKYNYIICISIVLLLFSTISSISAEDSSNVDILNFESNFTEDSSNVDILNFESNFTEDSSNVDILNFESNFTEDSSNVDILNFESNFTEDSSNVDILNFESNFTDYYNDDNLINSSENSSNCESLINTSIILKNATFNVDSVNYYQISLVDESGNLLTNKTLLINFNGKDYTEVTNENGSVFLLINLSNVNNYPLSCRFEGDNTSKQSFNSANINIKKISSIIDANNKSFQVNANENYYITLKDKYGNLLTNKNITVLFKGKYYNRITNSKGQISFKITVKTKKKYKLNIKFNGDNKYSSSSKTIYITIRKPKTQISTYNLLCDVKQSKTISVTLKNEKSHVLAKKTIKFKLNGKYYTRKTNSKGKAFLSFKLSSPKTYVLSSFFAGDKTYSKSSSTSIIQVFNNRTPIIVKTSNNYFKLNLSTNFTISLSNKFGTISNKTVNVLVDNKHYTVKTNQDGNASLNIKLTSLKQYPIYINVSGDYINKDLKYNSNLKVVSTSLIIQNKKILSEGYIRISLSSNYNSYVSNKVVNINLDNESFNLTTNDEGYIIFANNLTLGNHTISVSYTDDFGTYNQTKNISCIEGKVKNPFKENVPLLSNGLLDIDYLLPNFVLANENATYTLLKDQYKSVIKRDSYCLYLKNSLSKYTFFKTKEQPTLFHVIKREKWNIIEKEVNTQVVIANTYNWWPSEVTVSIIGKGFSYSEVRDEQNTGYTCGPTSASSCTQALRNYYNEAHLAKLAHTTYAYGTGSTLLKNALEKHNMSCEAFYKDSWNFALNELAKGGRALIFNTWNHYIAIIDINKAKNKVLVSNPSGTYIKGSHGIPTAWVSTNYLIKYCYSKHGWIVKLKYSLSESKKKELNYFYSNTGGKWNRTNTNEKPDKITNIWG